jgi:hypothetical protein
VIVDKAVVFICGSGEGDLGLISGDGGKLVSLRRSDDMRLLLLFVGVSF